MSETFYTPGMNVSGSCRGSYSELSHLYEIVSISKGIRIWVIQSMSQFDCVAMSCSWLERVQLKAQYYVQFGKFELSSSKGRVNFRLSAKVWKMYILCIVLWILQRALLILYAKRLCSSVLYILISHYHLFLITDPLNFLSSRIKGLK